MSAIAVLLASCLLMFADSPVMVSRSVVQFAALSARPRSVVAAQETFEPEKPHECKKHGSLSGAIRTQQKRQFFKVDRDRLLRKRLKVTQPQLHEFHRESFGNYLIGH